jgi:hypothetical protein
VRPQGRLTNIFKRRVKPNLISVSREAARSDATPPWAPLM